MSAKEFLVNDAIRLKNLKVKGMRILKEEKNITRIISFIFDTLEKKYIYGSSFDEL